MTDLEQRINLANDVANELDESLAVLYRESNFYVISKRISQNLLLVGLNNLKLITKEQYQAEVKRCIFHALDKRAFALLEERIFEQLTDIQSTYEEYIFCNNTAYQAQSPIKLDKQAQKALTAIRKLAFDIYTADQLEAVRKQVKTKIKRMEQLSEQL